MKPTAPIWDWRSPRPAPNSTADGTDPMNCTAVITPRMIKVLEATLPLTSPRWRNDARYGATATVISTATVPVVVKNTSEVRMTSAVSSLSPMAESRATRWTTAVDTPVSSRPR